MENPDPVHDQRRETPIDETTLASGEEALAGLMAEYETKLGEMRERCCASAPRLKTSASGCNAISSRARKFANERLLADMLPVIDNLERGLAADTGEAGGLRAGVELTLRELLRVVAAHGLLVVDPLAQPFDPERHQAMSMVDSSEHAAGTVVSVLQKGYVLNERLLRPALVNVAQASA